MFAYALGMKRKTFAGDDWTRSFDTTHPVMRTMDIDRWFMLYWRSKEEHSKSDTMKWEHMQSRVKKHYGIAHQTDIDLDAALELYITLDNILSATTVVTPVTTPVTTSVVSTPVPAVEKKEEQVAQVTSETKERDECMEEGELEGDRVYAMKVSKEYRAVQSGMSRDGVVLNTSPPPIRHEPFFLMQNMRDSVLMSGKYRHRVSINTSYVKFVDGQRKKYTVRSINPMLFLRYFRFRKTYGDIVLIHE